MKPGTWYGAHRQRHQSRGKSHVTGSSPLLVRKSFASENGLQSLKSFSLVVTHAAGWAERIILCGGPWIGIEVALRMACEPHRRNATWSHSSLIS